MTFGGIFRRDRQFFDYDLLANPLVPAGLVSNGYTWPQLTDSPHLFNTVRRMTDVNLTLMPAATISFRGGYSQNIAEGPTLSSIHEGTEGLLLQNWRHSTDTFVIDADWKPLRQTILMYQETITHYKGNTTYQMAPSGMNLQLANGMPVSLGYDNVTVPTNSAASSPCGNTGPILSSASTPPTANPCESGFLTYTRYAPARTLFPTEEFRFQSASIKNIHLNGHVSYTDANAHVPNFYEYFDGLGKSGLRIQTTTGNSWAARFNVTADYGMEWQITDKISLSDQFDFSYFRQPGDNFLTTVSQSTTSAQASMLNAPTITATTPNVLSTTYLGMETESNIITALWDASAKASFCLIQLPKPRHQCRPGWRYSVHRAHPPGRGSSWRRSAPVETVEGKWIDRGDLRRQRLRPDRTAC